MADSISKSFMSRRRAAGSAIACPLLPVGIDGGQGETVDLEMELTVLAIQPGAEQPGRE